MSVPINNIHVSDIGKGLCVMNLLGGLIKTLVFLCPCLCFPTVFSLLIHFGRSLSLRLLVSINLP